MGKAREIDREIRVNILEIIAVCMRMFDKTGKQNYIDRAREFGNVAAALKSKINSHDYSEEDKVYERTI